MYRHLLNLRKTDPVLRNRSRQHLSAGSVGTDLLWVKTETEAGERVLLWNVGTADLKLDSLPLPFGLPQDVIFYSEQEFLDRNAIRDSDHSQPYVQAIFSGPITELPPGHALLLGTPA